MSQPNLRFSGLLFALLSAVLVFGSAYVALHENRPQAGQALASPTSPPLTFPTPVLLTPGQPTPLPTRTQPTSAGITPPAACMPPAGWVPVTVQTGETLQSLANQYNTSPEALAEANCLRSEHLPGGALLYVPGTLPTQVQCGPPAGWVFYTVQPGENLFRIGLAFGVNVTTLQAANCMGSSTYIRAGQRLYVPNVPTRTPTHTARPAATATPTPSPSMSPTAAASATLPPTISPASSPTVPPTVGSATPTPSPTTTPTSAPSTATPTPSPTTTPTPALSTATPTPSPTTTPTPAPSTATPTPSPAPGTATNTPASTPTWTPTPTPTLLLLPSPTP